MNFLWRLNPNRIPDNLSSDDELTILQERILQYILLAASIAGSVVVSTTLFRDIPQGNWERVVIYSLVYLTTLALTFFRGISYQLRTLIVLGLIFAISLTDLLEFGMSGEGRITLISLVVIAAGLLNNAQGWRKYIGWMFLAGTVIFLTLFGTLMSNGVIPVPPIENMATSGQIGDWINGNLVFLLMATLAVSLVVVLTNGLNKALSSQKDLTRELKAEQGSLEQRVEERTQQLERRAVEIEAASTLAQNISSMANVDELLVTAVKLIQQEFGFYHAGIFLLDERQEYAVLKSATGDAGRRMLENNHKLKIGEVGIVGYVISRGEPRIALNVGEDAFHFKNPNLPLTQSEMALPLIASNKIIGALDVQSTKQNAFTQQDVMVLQIIADQLAVALEKAELVHQLRESLEELEKSYQQFTEKSWKKHLSTPKHRYGYRYKDSTVEQYPLENEEALEALQSGESVLTLKPIASTGQKIAGVAIPIKLRNTTLGVLNVQFDREKISEDLIRLLETSAERLGVALDNARLLEEVQLQAERDRMVTDITGKIRSSSDIDEILRTAAGELGKTLGISEVVVQLNASKNQGVK